MKQPCLIVALTLLAQSVPAWGALEVAPVFGNDMVLQQGREIPIWGEADLGATVMVFFDDQTKSTLADGEGKWRITLDPLEANDDGQLLEIQSGTTTETYSGVVVGEVWICSGQSNMVLPISESTDGRAVAEGANLPLIRLNPDDKTGWQVCGPETVGEFSAVAFFFGRAIHESQGNVPVGLILRTSGGAPIESWTPADNLMEIPFAKRIADMAADPELDRRLEAYKDTTRAWHKLPTEERAKTPKPVFKVEAGLHESVFGIYRMSVPGSLFRKEIQPLTPFPIRGAIWYQGERNAKSGVKGAMAYRDMMVALVEGWREAWDQDDLPFLLVQLPNFRGDPGWWRIQESQAAAAKIIPNSGLATTFDLGVANNINPPEKQPVGDRLARLARARVYGEKLPAETGPQFQNALFGKNSVLLTFDQVGLGLKASEEGLSGFQVAGEDRKFVDAAATVVDHLHVQVVAPKNVKPVAVRYGWVSAQQATLFNSEDLPAGPFRTDDW